MKSIKYFTLLIFFILPEAVFSQTSLTFNLNLQPQLEDSIFIPGKDKALVTGNILPFQREKTFELIDEQPIDSIYTVKIDFSGIHNGKNLIFNYLLQTEQGVIRESRPRTIQLRKGETNLDALYFDAFAF